MQKDTLLAILASLGMSLLVATLAVRLLKLGGWVAAIAGPLSVWWAGTLFILGLGLALAGSIEWPPRWRARYNVGMVAFVVGLSLCLAGVPWPGLVVLPVYATIEHCLYARFFVLRKNAVHIPLPTRLEILILSQVLGYLVGILV